MDYYKCMGKTKALSEMLVLWAVEKTSPITPSTSSVIANTLEATGFGLARSTAYAALNTLKEQGLVSCQDVQNPMGPPVTTYTTTPEGAAVLKQEFKPFRKFLEDNS